MPRATLLRQRLFLLFLIGLLLLFSPLVTHIEQLQSWRGMPALLIYLFTVWVLLIGLSAWVIARSRD